MRSYVCIQKNQCSTRSLNLKSEHVSISWTGTLNWFCHFVVTLQRDRKIDNIPKGIENECWSQNNPTKWRGQEGKLVGLSGPEHVTASPQAGHLLLLFIRFRSSSIPHNSHEGNYYLTHLLWNVRVSISRKWPFLTIYSMLFRGWWLLIGSLQVLIGFPLHLPNFL